MFSRPYCQLFPTRRAASVHDCAGFRFLALGVFVRSIFTTLLLLLSACSSKPPVIPDPASCADFDKPKSSAKPTLINGQPAPAGLFPASVVISAGGGRCTATVVGPRTVASAAHCMGNGGTVTFSIEQNRYSARCVHHPEYRGNATADWALCFTDREVAGVPYERIMFEKHPDFVVGAKVLNTGYGCTIPGGSGGNDGIYRIATSTVQSILAGNYDIVTAGGGALCFGDSGGPAFFPPEVDAPIRFVTSANSRGDIRTTSYLSAWFASPTKAYAEKFAADNNTKICGLHADATGCRGSEGPPPADAKFVVQTQHACVEGRVAKSRIGDKDSAKEKVRDALTSF